MHEMAKLETDGDIGLMSVQFLPQCRERNQNWASECSVYGDWESAAAVPYTF
jgi:hypothetical protein